MVVVTLSRRFTYLVATSNCVRDVSLLCVNSRHMCVVDLSIVTGCPSSAKTRFLPVVILFGAHEILKSYEPMISDVEINHAFFGAIHRMRSISLSLYRMFWK